MGVFDFINFVVYDNPVSRKVIAMISNKPPIPPTPPFTVITETTPLWKLAAEHGPYVKIAGILGATAVAIAAYGAHKSYPKDNTEELRRSFDAGSRMHLYHTLALMSVPLCRHPQLCASLFIGGIIFFSGTCYYYAFTGDKKCNKLAPIGGYMLIAGWLAMVL